MVEVVIRTLKSGETKSHKVSINRYDSKERSRMAYTLYSMNIDVFYEKWCTFRMKTIRLGAYHHKK